MSPALHEGLLLRDIVAQCDNLSALQCIEVSALNIYFHFLFIILFVKYVCFSVFTIYPFISNFLSDFALGALSINIQLNNAFTSASLSSLRG